MIKRPPHKGTVSNGPARNAGPFLFPTYATPAKFWPVTHCRLPAVAVAHVRRPFKPLCLFWPCRLPAGTVAAACGAAGTPLPCVAFWRSKPPAGRRCRRCRFAAAWPLGRGCGRLAGSRCRLAASGTVCRPLAVAAWPVIPENGRRCRRLPPIRPPPPARINDRFTKFYDGFQSSLTLVNLSGFGFYTCKTELPGGSVT